MAGIGADRTHVRTTGLELGWDHPDGARKPQRQRDWKRWILVLGLGTLSWVATFVGMLELIEANVGDLPFAHKMIVGFSVAMLMVMVVWLLDQIFSDIGWATRLLYVGGYVFLTLISVGFGFGFYWKVLESRGEASRSAESAVGQVQNALHAGVTRLEQLQGTLDSLTALSAQKATLEREKGTSCPNSRPGDGPRRQLRDDDASRFKFAADFVRGRVGAIKTELTGLNGDLAKVVSNDHSTIDAASGTRNDYMRGLNRRLDMTVTGFNAFRSDPQLRQIRADLADRSDRVSFPDTRGGNFQCPDAQLSAALKGVVRAIDELPSLEKPKIAAVEGSEAVIEAFRRLSASLFGALSFKMPPSPEELRELQKKAVQSVEASPATQARLNAMAAAAGLSKRDYIPLAIAIFVDLCLLLVSIKRPGNALDRLVPKMRAAEQGPVIQILSRFNEIHRDREIRENFEVFRHVVFDFHGDYYAAVPLNAPYRPNPRNGRQMQGYGVAEAEELLQEAHLLANLFASFEKERIFTRVMSPLLTTGTIQKRLRRQGSKFAHAEAFRVYRFRNGAWSDIILGAVMGAARRVEAGKRRRRFEEELFHTTGPDLSPHAPHPGTGYPRYGQSARPGEPHHGPLGRGEGNARGMDDPRRRASFSPRLVPGGAEEAAPGQAANGNAAPRVRTGDARPRSAGPSAGGSSERPTAENVVLHPAVVRAPGDTCEPALRDHDSPVKQAGPASQGEQTPDPAYRPIAPEPTSKPSSRQSEPPVAHSAAEPTVTVSATRESVTYTLPVSEARVPASLFGRDVTGPRLEQGAATEAGRTTEMQRSVTPPPLPLIEANAPPADHGGVADETRSSESFPPGRPPEISDDPRAIALRFGPQTREGGHA